jgi:cleavage and polyadenylation specificity factor subunit 3
MHNHSHSHDADGGRRNPHADLTPEDRFSRLCMFLEAQFGPEITPITKPKLSTRALEARKKETGPDGVKLESTESDEGEEDLADLEAEELERLHSMGIPVPGVEIKVDKHVARVWLETLEVECGYQVLKDRVKAVVERAVETVAPLWGQSKR